MASLGLFADDEEIVVVEEDTLPEKSTDPAAPQEIPTARNNAHLLGHEETEQKILRDWQAGRMPHALILSGAPGIGKATLAYRLARFLFNDKGAGLFGAPDSLYVAPDDPVFRRVASGGYADLLTIERKFDDKKGKMKTTIAVEDVRRIPAFLSLKPSEGGWRVVIVEDAEDLNISGQNALLKILEEPPPHTVLILTTSQPGGFLPTVRSRCRMIPMEPLCAPVMEKLIDRQIPGLTLYERTALMVLGEGSIGTALGLYQDGGIALYEKLIAFLSTLPKVKLPELHQMADKLSPPAAEQAYRTTFNLFRWWLARMVRHSVRGTVPPEVVQDEAELYKQLFSIYTPQDWLDIHDRVTGIIDQAEHSALDKRITILQAFQALQK